MSSQQLLEKIRQLPLHERIALLEQIARSLHEEILAEKQDSFDPSAIDRLHGVLPSDGTPLTDEDVDRIRYEYLMEKYK